MYSDNNRIVKEINSLAGINDYDYFMSKLEFKKVKETPRQNLYKLIGSNKDVSARAQYTGGVATIFIYSTSSNAYNGKGYRFFNFVRDNFFNGSVKDTFEYFGYNSQHTRGYNPVKVAEPEQPKEEKPIQFNYDLLFRADDDLIEERLSIQSENNNNRTKFDNDFFTNNPDIKKNRMFRIAVNPYVLNKGIDPKYKIDPIYNGTVYVQGFYNILCTYDEIFDFIATGYSVLFSEMIEFPLKDFEKITDKKPFTLPKPQDARFYFGFDPNVRTYKNRSLIKQSELLAIDIDNDDPEKPILTIDDGLNLELTQKALFLYTSSTHQKVKDSSKRSDNIQDRYRLVFDLPGTINNADDYSKITSKYIKVYNADEAPKDWSVGWYGNNNTTIYDFIKGEIINYNKGKITNENI